MDVQIDQAWHDGLGRKIDDIGTGVARRIRPAPDFGNLAIADDDRRWAAGGRCGIGQQIAYANDLVLSDGIG